MQGISVNQNCWQPAAEHLGGNQEDRLQRGNLLQTVIYQKGRNIVTLYPEVEEEVSGLCCAYRRTGIWKEQQKKTKQPPNLIFTH